MTRSRSDCRFHLSPAKFFARLAVYAMRGETFGPGKSTDAPRPSLDLLPRPDPPPAPQPQGGMGAAAGARKRADHRRPDLAAVRGRRRQVRTPVASMPGVERLSVDQAVRRRANGRRTRHSLHRAVSLYRSRAARRATAPRRSTTHNLVCRAVRAIKQAFPQLGVISDVALDPYTSHGHDGLMDGEPFSTTRPSRCWSRRRWSRREPAPTSSRPRT